VLKKPMISIVDDDPSARESLVDLVKSMGFSAEAFQSAEEFLQSKLLRDTSCLIADVQMPGTTGLELHTSLVRSGSAIPTILITAFPNEKDRATARRSGVTSYLVKPFDDNDLLLSIRSALALPVDGGRQS
jgi:FixJ family two-component response regulator